MSALARLQEENLTADWSEADTNLWGTPVTPSPSFLHTTQKAKASDIVITTPIPLGYPSGIFAIDASTSFGLKQIPGLADVTMTIVGLPPHQSGTVKDSESEILANLMSRKLVLSGAGWTVLVEDETGITEPLFPGGLVCPQLDPAVAATLSEYEKLNQENWDGYGAAPIAAETIDYARKLFPIIPATFGPPDISPGADGSIALEWHPRRGSVRKLFFDIGPGLEWSAYWVHHSGEFKRHAGVGLPNGTDLVLKNLFAELSR